MFFARSDQTPVSGQQIAPISYNQGSLVNTQSAFIFDRIFFSLAGNEYNHNISNEFKIRPDRTKDCTAELATIECMEKSP